MAGTDKKYSASSRAGAPIGIFDSGFGGLTVVREIVKRLPHEKLIFVGDSARCPYGPRSLEEVRGFAMEISAYLAEQGCKLIVIACNTATAAGLTDVQRAFDIPVVGVVSSGSRAAVYMTKSRRVGVIATEGTVDSEAYIKAIASLDAGIKVFQLATPEFVRIVEGGFSATDAARSAHEWDKEHRTYANIVDEKLQPFHDLDIDTLVLGCTHFPLIQDLIAESMGDAVTLVSSAEETAREINAILKRRGECAPEGALAPIRILTTADNQDEFLRVAKSVLGDRSMTVERLKL